MSFKILNQKDFKRELHLACICLSPLESFEHSKKVLDSHNALIKKVKRLEAEMSLKMVDYECPKCGHVEEDFEGYDVECRRCALPDVGNVEGEIYVTVTNVNMEQIFSPKKIILRGRG